MNPQVSVILPVFNGERFLNNSIRSFIKQTLKGIELIVVNDGSSDNTKAIVERFANEDTRIHLINLDENRGSSFARKTGVMAAKGDYIMFLDADDSLFLNACEKALIQIAEADADIVHFGTKVVFRQDEYCDSNEDKKDTKLVNSLVIDNLNNLLEPFDGKLIGERILRGCFEQNLFSYTIWNKIYRREICQKAFSHIPDIYLNLGDDELGFFYICYYSKKYVGNPRITLINYTFGTGISTQQVVTLNHLQQLARCLTIPKIIHNFLTEEGKLDYSTNIVENIYNKYQDALFDSLFRFINSENSTNIRKALVSALQYCDPLALIKFLMPRFTYKPSVVADGLLDTDMAKPIKKPVKTIGTYYSRIRDGGAEKVISLLVPMWVAMGYQVVLFTDEPPHDNDYPVDATYTRIVLPNSVKLDDYDAKADVLDRALRDHQVDVMIYHKWVHPHLMWDMLVCKQANCAFYVYAHSTIDFMRFADSEYQKFLVQLPIIYKLTDCVIALTEMDTAFWEQFSPRAIQVSNPCEITIGNSWNRTNQNNEILWVGRISDEKRPMELIRILEIVLKQVPEAKLIIVGDGEPEMIKQIINYAKKRKIADHITLTGFQLTVEPFYQQSDIFLFTSAYEGFALSLLETQAFGLPIVMYDLPYLALVQEGKGIITVEQHAVKQAADAIVEVLTNQEKYSSLSQGAYENAKHFNGIDLKVKWKQIFTAPLEEGATRELVAPTLALRLALSSWTRFNVESSQKTSLHPSSDVVVQAVQQKLFNMSITEATVHLGKTLARKVLGKNLSDKFHLFRVRNQK